LALALVLSLASNTRRAMDTEKVKELIDQHHLEIANRYLDYALSHDKPDLDSQIEALIDLRDAIDDAIRAFSSSRKK
jgi:hypothetical protein